MNLPPNSPRITRSRSLQVNADIAGIQDPYTQIAYDCTPPPSSPPNSPEFYHTAGTLPLNEDIMTDNIQERVIPEAQATTTQTSGAVLQPSFQITRFNGSGSLHIDRLIRDVEDFILSAHPAASNIPEDFSRLCLQHVSSRLDTSNPRVRDILTGLESEPVVTWTGFKERFREAFAPTPRPPYIEMARLLAQKPPFHSTTDMISHMGRTQEALKKVVSAMEEGSSPRWQALAAFIRANYKDMLTFYLLTNYTMALPHPVQEAMSSKLWATPAPTNISFVPRYFMERYSEVIKPQTSSAPSMGLQATRKSTGERYPKDPRIAGENTAWAPNPEACYKCLKEGHRADRCRNKEFCAFHGREGHSWAKCRTFPQRVKKAWEIIKQRKGKKASNYSNYTAEVHFLGQNPSVPAAGNGWQSSTY